MVIRSDNVTFKYGDSVSSDEVPTPPAVDTRVLLSELDDGTTILATQLAAARKAKYPERGRGSRAGTGHLAHSIYTDSLLVQAKMQDIATKGAGSLDDAEELKNRLGHLIVYAILFIDELNDSAEDVVNKVVENL